MRLGESHLLYGISLLKPCSGLDMVTAENKEGNITMNGRALGLVESNERLREIMERE